MSIAIHTFILGPIQNNTYLIADEETKQAALIDPAVYSQNITDLIEKNGWELKMMLITHAHFDHIGGVKGFQSHIKQYVQVGLHPLDQDLWQSGGGSRGFGFEFDAGEAPDWELNDGQEIYLGRTKFLVLHTPGHTRGHVTFVNLDDKIAFCGDLIFFHGIGRTDLDVGNETDLFHSIQKKIFNLPEDVILYPGHGDKTSVREEKLNNPFLR